MLQHVDIARSFLIEARVDRHSAEVLTDHGEYARAIAHAQQTVEKLLKAVLAVRIKKGVDKRGLGWYN
jgi:HEPN domain-containing protein